LRLPARQHHVHPRMRIQQRKCETFRTRSEFSRDHFKWRSVGYVSALARRDDMARDASRFRDALPLSTSAASAIDATQIPVTSEQKRSGCTDPSIKHLQRRPRLRQEPAHASCAASTHEIHAFLIQIKIQLARPPSLTRMEAIFDLQTTLEKFGSWLRKRVPGLRRDLAPRRRRRTGHSAHRAATARGRGGCGQRGLDAAHSQRTAKSERQGASQEVTRDDFIGLLKGTAHWS
jgi:hypothetical protein